MKSINLNHEVQAAFDAAVQALGAGKSILREAARMGEQSAILLRNDIANFGLPGVSDSIVHAAQKPVDIFRMGCAQ